MIIPLFERLKKIVQAIKMMYYSKHHRKVVRTRRYKMMFQRWKPLKPHTWQHRLFGMYNEELIRMMRSYTTASKYSYHKLGEAGAEWGSLAKDYFFHTKDNTFTIRMWSNTFHSFENWTYLNCAMALSSYFETYLSSVIIMALESDPGALIGKPHAVDGMELIKNKKQNKNDINSAAMRCTKGNWTKRTNAMQKLFGKLPDSMMKNIKTLEDIRIMRNKVGHAFGRDIRKSRELENATKLPMERLSKERFDKWQKKIDQIVDDMDTFLLANHIGSFQPLLVYHALYPSLNQDKDPKAEGERAKAFKKKIGGDKQDLYSKDFCRTLVQYYERL